MIKVLMAASVYSCLLPIAMFLIFWKRNMKNTLWVILIYVVLSMIADIIQSGYTYKKDVKSQEIVFFVSTFFTALEGSIFGYYLINYIKSFPVKRLMLVIYALDLSFGLYTAFFNQPQGLNNHFITIEQLSLILFCVFYFYEQVNNPEVTFLYASKEFWIIVSFFFYGVSTLFLFITTPLLTADMNNKLWGISQTANMTKNLLFAIGFWKNTWINKKQIGTSPNFIS